MKKNIILIISTLIFCLISFLNNWYRDNILFHLTIAASIVFDLALFLTFIILLNTTFKSIKKQRKSGIIALIILVTSIILSFYDFRLIKAKLELKLFEKERKIVIEKIKNNEFAYYYAQNIKLPIYKHVSSDGEVYVYQNNENQVIGFWIFRGMQSGSIELIYSSGGKELIMNRDSGHTIRKIIKLKENWFYVISDY